MIYSYFSFKPGAYSETIDNVQNGEDIIQKEQSKRNYDKIAESKFGASGIHIRGPSSRGGKEVVVILGKDENTCDGENTVDRRLSTASFRAL